MHAAKVAECLVLVVAPLVALVALVPGLTG